MARLFDDASSEYLQINQAVLSGIPLVMVCWFNTDVVGTNKVLICLADKDVTRNYHFIIIDALNKVRAQTDDSEAGDTSVNAATITEVSINTWHHVCGIFVSASDRRVFLDGSSKATNFSSKTPVNLDRTSIGRTGRGTSGLYMSGRIAEAAIYDLSVWPGANDIERADNFERILPSLAKGFSPLFYPLGLVAHWPLIRDTDNDIVGGYNMTPYNTPSIGDHPRIILPQSAL